MKIIDLKWHEDQKIYKELHIQFPKVWWWGMLNIILTFSIILSNMSEHMLVKSYDSTTVFVISLSYTIFMIGGWFRTVRVYVEDEE